MSPTVIEHARKQGVKFADAADAANAILKISSKTSINGKSHLYLIGLLDH